VSLAGLTLGVVPMDQAHRVGKESMDVVAPPVRELVLLSQLTRCAQQPTLLSDGPRLVAHVAALLQQNLPCAWGALVLLEQQTISAQAHWGLNDEQVQHAMYRNGVVHVERLLVAHDVSLQFGDTPVGFLRLGAASIGLPTLDDAFVQTLADQIALLFGLHQNHTRERLATTLAAVTLDLVGQLDTRALFLSILRHGVLLIDGSAGALYRLSDTRDALELVATHGTARPDWEEQVELGDCPVGTAAMSREMVVLPSDVPDSGGGVAVPLVLHNQVLGVLLLRQDEPSRPITPILREMLETFAAQATLVLRNARLFEEEQQRGRELFTLYENSRVITSAQRPESMFDRLTENIALALQCDRAALYRRGGARHEFGLLASYTQEGIADEAWDQFCQVMLPHFGQLVRQGTPLVLEDTALKPSFFADAMRSCNLRNALLLPLRVKEQPLGVLCVGRSWQRHGFSRTDINLAQTMASQLAAALAHQQLDADKQRRIAEIDLCYAIGIHVGDTASLDETLRLIVVGVERLIRFDYAAVALLEEQQLRDALVVMPGGTPPAPRVQPGNAGFAGWLARHRRALRLDDIGHEAPVAPGALLLGGEQMRSYLGVPLLLDGRFVGLIELTSAQLDAFSDADERLLTIVASQISHALANVQRYQQHDAHLRARVLQLGALQRVGRQLTSTLFLPQNLDFILTEAVRATHAARGMVVLRGAELLMQGVGGVGYSTQADHDQFRVAAVVGYADDARSELLGALIEADDPIIEQVLKSNNFKLCDEPTAVQTASLLGSASASLLAMPIFYEEQIVGVVNLQSDQLHAFDHDALEFVRALTDHTALAIGNAQRFEEQRAQRELLMRRARTLDEVLQIGQALRGDRSLIEVLEQIAFGVVETTAYRTVIFHMLDLREPEVLRVTTGAGLPLSDLDRLREGRLPVELALRFLDPRFRIGRCYFVPAEHMQQLALGTGTDEALAEQEVHGEWQLDDLLLVPLYSTEGQLLGLMNASDPISAVRPTAREVEPLEIFADQAAIAAENNTLLQEARSSANALALKVGELETLLEAASVLSSSLEPQAVLSSLMEVVGRHLKVTTVALWTLRDRVLTPSAMLGIPEEVARTMHVQWGAGFTGRVAAEGHPLMIADVEDDGHSLFPSFNREHHLRSYLGVPVRYQERVVGVLSVMTTEQRQFSPDDVTLLSGLADQAAIALENARLFSERERQLRELSVLNEIGTAVTATLDQHDVLARMHEGIGRVLDVSTSLVGLYDAALDTLSYVIAYDHDQPYQLSPVSAPQGAHGWVVRNRQPLLLHTEAQGVAMGLHMVEPHERGQLRVQSMLVAPILVNQRVLGVLSVQSYRAYAYSEDDLRFVSTAATQAAAALENARLFDETRQSVHDLQSLYDNSLSLARTLDPEEAQQLVVNSAYELLHVDLAALFLYDTQRELRLQVWQDPARTMHVSGERWEGYGLNDALFEHDTPLAISNYLHEWPTPHPRLVRAGVQSALGVIIGSHEHPLGTLWLATVTPRVWSERQISLLSIFATQAGQALENARLFESEQAKRRLADTLREVARTLTSSLALDEIQDLIFAQLARVVPYDSASIMLRDGDELYISAARGFDQPTLAQVLHTRFPLNDDPDMRAIIESRQPLVLYDMQQSQHVVAIEGTEYIRGWLGAPLLLNNEVIGVLTVDSHVVGAYDEEDASVAFALASQGAQAIRNGRLFEELNRNRNELEQRVIERTAAVKAEKERLEVIHSITLELTATLDLGEILQKTLKLIAGAIGVRRASIMLRDPAQGELICRAVLHDNGMDVSANQAIRFEGGEGLAGWVMRYQKPVLIPDVRRDARWVREPGRAEDVRSLAAVPLISADEPLGVLILSSTELAYFSDDHLRLLSTIANEVAIAIYNAELYSWLSDIANKLSETLTTQREENSKSLAILRSVSEGVIVLDEQQRVVLFNPAAEEVLGLPPELVLEKRFDSLASQVGDEDQRQRLEILSHGLWDSIKEANERAAPRSLTIELLGQTIAVNVAPVLAPDETNYGTVAVLRDITREIEADRVKRDFVSTVSHELRTPLTSIRGYVDLLLLGAAGGVNENQLAFLNVVKTNTTRLMDLINDILALSSLETGKIRLNIEPVELGVLISDVSQSLKVELEKKEMILQVAIADELPTIEGDRKRITQVITNLYSNAIKYTFPQGRIEVRAFCNPAGLLQVDVQDNGVGISPEQQKLLFSRFYRADNPLRDEAGGTGLGLSIAKSFVELHGGEMWVSSALGEGSTFSFVLPLTQPEHGDEDEE
jgi:PAS domain S-box-containing protein